MPNGCSDEAAGRTDCRHGVLVATASPRRARIAVLRIARAFGAIALFVVGGVHFEQYKVAHFSVIPTIGSLFLANFIAATIVGLVLLIPVPRTFGPRRLAFDSLAALAGIGVAAGAMAALLISEHTPLFGFMEHGYRLEIVISLAAEAVVIVSLGVSWPALTGRRAFYARRPLPMRPQVARSGVPAEVRPPSPR